MKAKKIALCGLLTAVALVLSYIESLVPLSFAVPGIKMGLPNIAVVFVLYAVGKREAWLISLLRVLLVSALFGNAFSFAYSAVGAMLSLGLMCLLARSGKFSAVGVSVAGALAHNFGQILVAVAVLKTPQIAFYLPALCISAAVTGVCIGLVAGMLVKRIKV